MPQETNALTFPLKRPPKTNSAAWNILIVDDEAAVHEVTRLVLSRKEFDGRQVNLVSVYSAQEAKEELSKIDANYAAAFIDVVMEKDDSGLSLVQWIRQELKNHSIRLVLRTGQAGLAPEEKVIRDFDINDYKTKTELTAKKLVTTTYTAIRGFRDISIIERSLVGFQELIQASNHMLQLRELKSFGSAALNHLLTLMNVESSALYIAHAEEDVFNNLNHMVVACTGKFVSHSNDLYCDSISDDVREKILNVFKTKVPVINQQHYIGYYQTASNTSSVLYIEIAQSSDYFHSHVLELYSTNVALILENILARNEIEDTQKEIMYIVGDAIEARSKETGAHVKRVAVICEKLAMMSGQSDLFCKLIKFAAPLHDVGKIGIPENIIHKPGKLNDKEWEVMKTHAAIGGELLSRSKMPVAKLGARLARHHHENWDGSGYPDALKGEDIPLEARIMAVADVFDALGSKRSYKSAWENEGIYTHIKEQRSKKFDPVLTDILLDNFELFCQIREDFPD